MTTRLDVSIGPVQGFVVQSRRTRDLWGSSYLLSVLSAYAMRGAENAAGRGKIVSPIVEDNPLYKWVSSARNGKAPQIGSLPNHFVVEVEEGKRPEVVARAATRALDDAWQQVCDAVRRCIVQKVQDAGCGTEAIWERQTRNFWEVVWTVETEPGGGSFLSRRKRWRCHRPSDEPGDKCTLMHDFQELSGYVRAESGDDRRKQEEFWRRVRDHSRVGPLDLREDERLCAIALVKRLFSLVPKALDWSVNRARSWPSTVHIGASPWINRVRSAAPLEAERYARAVATARGTGDEAGDAFTRLDASWFHLDFVRDDRRCPILSTDTENESRTRDDLVRRLMAIYQASDGSGRPLGRPSAFYALLKADGDRLGKLLSDLGPKGPELVGNALAEFTCEVPKIVEKHRGVTVYAGGDDVLAMLPVPHALSCAEELEKRYRRAFEERDDATLSAAVLFVHARSPLSSALDEAGRLLDEVAKDGNGRDSLATGVLKPGGLHCQWVTTWTRRHSERDFSAVQSLDHLVQKLRRNDDGELGLSSSLVYRIRETLSFLHERPRKSKPISMPRETPGETPSFLYERPRWEPGTWADPLEDLDVAAFLHAEIVRSLSIHSGGEAEKHASEWTELVQEILSRARREEASDGTAPVAVGIDALLLARFLANPDDEGASQ